MLITRRRHPTVMIFKEPVQRNHVTVFLTKGSEKSQVEVVWKEWNREFRMYMCQKDYVEHSN